MISGLNKLPPLLSFLTKKVLQPFDAPLKGIVDKAEAILIAFDGRPLVSGLSFWELMDRHLIFPLRHKLPSSQIS